ncbi:MAG: mammalian cell entry protein [Rhodocyclaceae bacterium]|nr:mammalian cell entry protein [Rhodocyclaceae bacterium]MBP6108326.1 mammalian cell entry protein [Rhodocyclaceae bacterium]MBP6278342.1 mammalian cell entry protein [Rhodocyclaceae bacterium]
MPHVAHAELKAKLLLLLLFVLVGGFVAYALYARGAFENTQRLVLVAENSEGVIVGMDLNYAGFPIGRVRRVDLGDDGKARILIELPQKDARWLRTTSVFIMVHGLVGGTKLRAYTGLLDDPALPDGAERPVLIGDITSEIPGMISNLNTLVTNLERITAENSSLNASLANVKNLTERMQGPYGAMGVALGSDGHAKKIIQTLDSTNALLAKTDARVFGSGGVMDSSQEAIRHLNGALVDASANLKKVDAILADLQVVSANAKVATTDLGALRADVDASLSKVSHLIDEVNRKWPFARDAELKLP